jgi:hypothetical protein
MPLKLKFDEAGHVVVQDGKPVYITDDNKEVAFDAEFSNATISRLNGEAKGHREKAEAAEEKLKAYEGIEDPALALEAIQKVANLGSGELKTAQQVQEIKDQAKKAAEDQVREAAKASATTIANLEKERDGLRDELHSEKIGGEFKGSKFISEKVSVPMDMVQSVFGKNFKYEEKRTVGYDNSGNKIYSRANPGELATFDEAFEIILDSYAYKDNILKGVNNSGGGSDHSQEKQRGGNFNKGDMGGNQQQRAEAIASRWPELAKNAK